MYIVQQQLQNLREKIAPQKAVIIYGPRRCGKTTLLEHLVEGIEESYLFVSGEDITIKEYLSSESIEVLKDFVGNHKLLIIDEAQKIKNIGLNIKLILDHISDIKVVATGSSAFDLGQQMGEPLTGRKYSLRLFPLAQLELSKIESKNKTIANLKNRLIYGSYPEVVLCEDNTQRRMYLKELTGSYLCKDILEIEGIRHADKIIRLLQLLAFQIGKEVSYTELGKQLGMSKNTVDKYLDLLEKTFVIFKLMGFSRNLRKETTKNHRYFFHDLGIRNALINNFNTLSMRDDVGMLWENYCIVERIKKQEYYNMLPNYYFWRTYDRNEIDFVEDKDGKLNGYEIKWGNKEPKPPQAWISTYKSAGYQIINRDNYLTFIT